jgi:hypothetical protein
MAGPISRLRSLLLLLCVLASTLQGFVAQTHVHAAPALSAAASTDSAGPADPADPPCLLCDIAGHSPGVAPPPAADALVAPSLAGRVPPLPGAAPAFLTRASHHWLGRGPPPV